MEQKKNKIHSDKYVGRADLHIHTTYSDGMYNPGTVMLHLFSLNRQYQKSRGYPYIDVIAISDHDEIEGAIQAERFALDNGIDIEVIIGSEVSSKDGHILAVNITHKINRGMTASDTINAIHDQGGLAIAAHPYTLLWLAGVRGVGAFIKTLPFDAVESKNSNITELISNYYTLFVNRNNQNLPEVGNSDAHFLAAFEKVTTKFEGKTKKDLLDSIATGHIYAGGYHWGLAGIIRYLYEKRALSRYCQEHGIKPHNL